MDVPLCRHLLSAVSQSAFNEMETSLFVPLCRHPVWPDGGSVFVELSMYELAMCMYAPLCRQLLFFDPAVHRTTSVEGEMFSLPPFFMQILKFYYCDYLRELDLGSGRSPDGDEADPFHEQTRWAKEKRFRDGHSRCHGTMGSQASRDTCEGDIRLRVTRPLSPICSGYPSTFAVAGPEADRTQTYCYYTPAQFLTRPHSGLAFLTAPRGQRGPPKM